MNSQPDPSVLALDLATQTGWALMANGVRTSGSQGFHRYAGSQTRAADHYGQPYLDFQRWIRERIKTDKPTIIVYEEVYRWLSADSAKAYGAFRGSLLIACAYYGIPVKGYAVAVIKKAWTGKGNADKAAMMAETRRRYPELQLTDDNESDALAILDLHITTTTPAHATP